MQRIPRTIRFAMVGATCAAIQLLILAFLVWMADEPTGLIKNVSNAFAFFASAQLNFLISSKVTWSDRTTNRLLRRFVAYNSMVTCSWVVNQTAFAVTVIAVTSHMLAGVFGILVASAFTFLASDKLVFARQAGLDVSQQTGD